MQLDCITTCERSNAILPCCIRYNVMLSLIFLDVGSFVDL
jgi:hypothetical protein